MVEKIFSANGFETVSAICKVGRIAKDQIGVGPDQQVAPNTMEIMCNPVQQAMVLNREQTDLNVLLGLCVGHDSLFLKYAEAPVRSWPSRTGFSVITRWRRSIIMRVITGA